jgi:hypothetical protein
MYNGCSSACTPSQEAGPVSPRVRLPPAGDVFHGLRDIYFAVPAAFSEVGYKVTRRVPLQTNVIAKHPSISHGFLEYKFDEPPALRC